MAAPKFSTFLFAIGVTFCSNASETIAIEISNNLSACVTIEAFEQIKWLHFGLSLW